MATRRYGRFNLETLQGTDPATVDDLWLGIEFLKYISPGVLIEGEEFVPLVEEDPVFVDLGMGKNFELTLTADRTIDSPLDQKPGRYGFVRILQDGTGGHALSWHTDWNPIGGTAPSIRTGPGQSTAFRYCVLDVGDVELEKVSEFAALADVLAGTAQDKALSPYSAFESIAEVTLADGASIIPDLNEGLVFALTIADDRHISNPINQRRGKGGRLYIRQDDNGGHSVTWDTDWHFVGGVVPSVPIAPGAWTIVPYEVRAPGDIIAASVDPYAGAGGGGETVPAATQAEVRSAAAISKYVNPSSLAGLFTPYNLPNASTVLPDMDLALNFILTLQQNCLIQNLAHQRPGNGGFIIIIQAGAGGFTATWDTNYTFVGGTPVIPSVAGEWTLVEYRVQAFGIIRCVTIPTSGIPQAATVQDIWTGTEAAKFVTPNVARASRVMVPLTDGATINVDLNTGINFKVTIAGDRAIANPTNQAAGKEGIIRVKQDVIGGRVLSWGDQFVFEGDPPELSPDPDATSVIPYHVEEVGQVIVG